MKTKGDLLIEKYKEFREAGANEDEAMKRAFRYISEEES